MSGTSSKQNASDWDQIILSEKIKREKKIESFLCCQVKAIKTNYFSLKHIMFMLVRFLPTAIIN